MNYKQKTKEINKAIEELRQAAYNLRETTESGRAGNRFRNDWEYAIWFGNSNVGKAIEWMNEDMNALRGVCGVLNQYLAKYPLTPDEAFPKLTPKICVIEEITENGWVVFNDTYLQTGDIIHREYDGECYRITADKKVETKLHAKLTPCYNDSIWSIRIGYRFTRGIQLFEENPK